MEATDTYTDPNLCFKAFDSLCVALAIQDTRHDAITMILNYKDVSALQGIVLAGAIRFIDAINELAVADAEAEAEPTRSTPDESVRYA